MAAYRKKGKICDCTMGAIYLAYDEANDRDVVLKQLSFPRDKDMRYLRNFVATIDDARKLNHEHIMSIYGIIHEAFDVKIAMELMRCKTLQQKMDAGANFSVNASLSIGIQLVGALQYAHDAGIYHGSINAGHVYLRKDGLVKLNNFGFNYNVEGVLIGPATSRSPEQWNGEALTRKSDIYGLGILLYQLLSGRFPYRATSGKQLRDRVLNLPPLKLEALAPKVPFDLHEVVMRAINKDPSKRFQTMIEMESALRAAAKDPSISSKTDAFLIHELNNQAYIANNIDFTRSHWPLQILNAWPARRVHDLSRHDMITYLLDKKQHAESFSGAAIIDLNTMLLCWSGHLIACIDLNNHHYGDAVLKALPEHVEEMVLFTPISLHLRPFVLLLATILRNPKPLYDTLNSEQFVSSEFVSKLEHDQFTGVLRLKFDKHTAWIGFESGHCIFMLKNDYTATPTEKKAINCDLNAITEGQPYKLDVYATSFTPLQCSLQHTLHDSSLRIFIPPETKTLDGLLKMKPRQLTIPFRLQWKESVQLLPEGISPPSNISFGAQKIDTTTLLNLDDAYHFCRWFLFELYPYLLAEGHKDSLKYMLPWMMEVSDVRLHHALIDNNGQRYLFDIVTYNKAGKVLHVIKRGENSSDGLKKFVRKITAM
ncbi:MAG: serine/threonine-protein kinase, partial [Mariprofundaceae bacterium]|nr:serine/threonine-protein kinase [Mariprofundaceae bacterium]